MTTVRFEQDHGVGTIVLANPPSNRIGSQFAVDLRAAATGTAFVRHQANAPSSGQVTDIEISAFLSGPRNPEHEALLRLIGASILNPHGAEADDAPAVGNTRKEWTDGELNELGNMLVRGLSIEEIAHRLRRDQGEVRDKVAEVGRACRVDRGLRRA